MIKNRPSSDGDTAIVNPVVNKRSPKLGEAALMVSPKTDLNYCRRQLNYTADNFFHLYLSRLYYQKKKRQGLSLVGPMVGSPYAAMVLESLISWGCRNIFFFGWCGSIDPKVKTGDIIIPTKAVIDEGTSHHYLDEKTESVRPAEGLFKALTSAFDTAGIYTHKGPVWTTDGVYRETKQKVIHYQKRGVIGVEMELSALLSVASFRKVDVAGLLVVSDELSTLTWQPGFNSSAFQKGRITALERLLACCIGISNG